MGTITLSNDAYNVNIEMPLWNYHIDYIFPFIIKELGDGTYAIWDNGSAYDKRILRAKFVNNESDHKLFFDFMNNISKGRGNNINAALGASPTGFYPAGPDKGDSGTFVIRLIDYRDFAMENHPWKYFFMDISFLIVSCPVYELPSVIEYEEGDYYIYTTDNLMSPQDGFDLNSKRSIMNTITNGNVVATIDLGNGADCFNTKFKIGANQPNAASLMNKFVNDIRSNAFEIDNSSNIYPFGIVAEETLPLFVRLIENKITVTHENYNTFGIDLTCNLNAVNPS